MFKTHPIKLKELLDQAENKKIQLPDFQRGWIWDDDRISRLLKNPQARSGLSSGQRKALLA